eukprot:scaffold49167_cov71-Phaeocystis_antarctica.AAC.5
MFADFAGDRAITWTSSRAVIWCTSRCLAGCGAALVSLRAMALRDAQPPPSEALERAGRSGRPPHGNCPPPEAQCEAGSPTSKPAPNQGSAPGLEGLDAPPWSAPEQKIGAPAQPKSAPEKPASAPEPPKSAAGKAGPSTSPATTSPATTAPASASPATTAPTTASDCPPTPRLPSGSHCILVVAEAPEDGNPEMGMANRMHRMADALVSIGVVVH